MTARDAALQGSRPIVTIGPVPGAWGAARGGLIELSCSTCGLLSDPHYCSNADRGRLSRAAYVHAEEVHDGLVDREGWK